MRLERVLFVPALALFVVVIVAPATSAANDPAFDRQWGMKIIGAPQAWSKGTGDGIVIATVDSGVDLEHEDLKSQILPGKDYVDGDSEPQDGNGHGTHVAGIAAAATGNGKGVVGVAPGAKILPVRFLDDNGSALGSLGTPIRWATDHGADVINVSASSVTQGLGQDEELFGPDFREAIEYAWSKGVIVVLAAGNDFLLSSGYADHSALVVSATDRNDSKPDFSSGVGQAKWGIAAPGGSSSTDPIEGDIYSTFYEEGETNSYDYLRGTSMAAPHVTGAAAVLRGLGVSPKETVDQLLATAKDIGPRGKDSTFGYGRLDLAAAVTAPKSAVTTQAGGTTGGDDAPAGDGSGTGTSVDGRSDLSSKRTPNAEAAATDAPNGVAVEDDRALAREGTDGDKTRSRVPGVIAAAVVLAAVGSVWVYSRQRGRASSKQVSDLQE